MRLRRSLGLRHAALFAPLALALAGCPAVHQPPPVRAQEAASELNLNTRFGRMELAAEHVAPKERDSFFARRKDWGGPVRIADYELAGLRMHGEESADVFVKVAWFRMNEQELRVSTLKQKWQTFGGEWKLVEEARSEGDVGLLGEHVPVRRAEEPKRTQFPTIRLGEQESSVGANALH